MRPHPAIVSLTSIALPATINLGARGDGIPAHGFSRLSGLNGGSLQAQLTHSSQNRFAGPPSSGVEQHRSNE